MKIINCKNQILSTFKAITYVLSIIHLFVFLLEYFISASIVTSKLEVGFCFFLLCSALFLNLVNAICSISKLLDHKIENESLIVRKIMNETYVKLNINMLFSFTFFCILISGNTQDNEQNKVIITLFIISVISSVILYIFSFLFLSNSKLEILNKVEWNVIKFTDKLWKRIIRCFFVCAIILYFVGIANQLFMYSIGYLVILVIYVYISFKFVRWLDLY